MTMSEKKTILILTDWFFPGYKAGGPIQSCKNFIAAMSDCYNIYVITSDRDMGDGQSYADIQVNQWNNYMDNARVYYATALSLGQLNALHKQIAPDFVYLNSMFSLRYAIFPLWLAACNKITAQLVLAPRGMLHAGAMHFKTKKKKLFLAIIKATGVQKKIRFHATDKQEAEDIASFFPEVRDIIIATNFPRMQQPDFIPAEKQPGILRCIYVSRIAAKKNILYFLDVLRQIPVEIQFFFDICGEVDDKSYYNQCIALIKTLPPHVRVRFNGPVNNEAVPKLLQQYHLFVLPTLGENFGHAIFEAFLSGRPVLISDQSPWRGLTQKKAGWDIALQDRDAFLQVILKAAAMTANEINEWCRGAWALANEFIKHTEIREQNLKLFN